MTTNIVMGIAVEAWKSAEAREQHAANSVSGG